MKKVLDNYVYTCLKKYGNALLSENDYKKLGKSKILIELKEHGFDCKIIIYEHKNEKFNGTKIGYHRDIIAQVKKKGY